MSETSTQAKLTFLERSIAHISPNWAFNRACSRIELEALRNYEAASRKERLSEWVVNAHSPDGVTRGSKVILRNRTRDLYRNNSWYWRATQILTHNVIGIGLGVKLKTKEKTNNRRDRVKENYLAWFQSKDCHFEGTKTGNQLQRLIYRTKLISGQTLIRKRIVNRQLKLQILEPDFLDESKDMIKTEQGGYISQGIEYNAKGQITHYWLHDHHPNDFVIGQKYESQRVRAQDIISFYNEERPGQGRGVPAGTQIILRLRELDVFLDAELKKNQIASLLVGFRKKTGGARPPSAINNGSSKPIRLYPGTVEELSSDEEMAWSQPPQHHMFPEYVRTILMEIAAAFGITYEQLSGDLKRTNFSSGRMGWIESSRFMRTEQDDFINGVLNPIFNWWLEIENLRTGLRTNGLKVSWALPHREMIDPTKEIKAFREAAEGQILSRTHIWTSLGLDPDEVLEEIKEIQDKMDKLGILPPSSMTGKAVQDEEQDDDEEEDDEDAKEDE